LAKAGARVTNETKCLTVAGARAEQLLRWKYLIDLERSDNEKKCLILNINAEEM
jgi:hypothetical protein